MMADLWRNVLQYSNKSQDDVNRICVPRPVISCESINVRMKCKYRARIQVKSTEQKCRIQVKSTEQKCRIQSKSTEQDYRVHCKSTECRAKVQSTEQEYFRHQVPFPPQTNTQRLPYPAATLKTVLFSPKQVQRQRGDTDSKLWRHQFATGTSKIKISIYTHFYFARKFW